MKDILSFENLYISSCKCARNVRWKKSVAYYLLNQLEETYKLHKQLHEGTYKERNHKQFKIFEPKERDVLSISFRDRVYQRTLNDLVIYPTMTKSFIYDNCACQRKRGTDFARGRLRKHLRRFYVENGNNKGYLIHIDIRHYYPNMSHRVAEELLGSKLPPAVYEHVKRMLAMYSGEKGYFAGSQLIQILGVSVLDRIDHFIKEKLKVKHYVRYMDDLILVVKDNPYFYLARIEEQLEKIEFELNTDKTKVVRLNKGDTFLGFKFSLSETGRVYQCLSTQNMKRRKRKLRRVKYRSQQEMEESFNTWKSYAQKSTSQKRIREVIDHYEKFYKNGTSELRS